MKKNKEYYLGLKYPIRIVEDEAGECFVEIPDLPGCMTVVNGFEDAREAIERVKEGWIELALEDGQEIPLPSTERKYSGKFSLRIPPSLHEGLVAQAAAEGVSLNQYCTYVLALGTGHYERKMVATEAPDDSEWKPPPPCRILDILQTADVLIGR